MFSLFVTASIKLSSKQTEAPPRSFQDAVKKIKLDYKFHREKNPDKPQTNKQKTL